jgi:zinc transport system ATP-binding protein
MSESAIDIANVWFRYAGPGPAGWTLEDVSLRVAPRDYLGIIGPNGGGKTTLLKIILGLLRPQRGQVRVFGRDPRDARQWIGYVPQHARLDLSVPATALDVVLMGRLGRNRWGMRYRRADRDAARAALAQVGVESLAAEPVAALSGGQRQRVLVARALASEARVLLLDEPTSGADPHMEKSLYDLLARLNKDMPIIVVSHDIGFVSDHVRHIACLNRRLVSHAAGQISSAVLADLYHDHGHVRRIEHDHACPTHELADHQHADPDPAPHRATEST